MSRYFALAISTAALSLCPVAGAQDVVFTRSALNPDGDAPLLRQPIMPAATSEPFGGSLRGDGWNLIENRIDDEGDTPTDIAFSADGTRFIVAHRDSHNLVVFNAATRAVVDVIPLSGSPHALAVSSDGVHAISANVYEDTASIVDLTLGQETAVVPVGGAPGVARITPDGATAVIGNTGGSSLSVIDLASGVELRRISGTPFTKGGSLAPEPGVFLHLFSQFECAGNTTVVHPDYFGSRILLVNIATGAVTSLPSNATPRDLAVTPDGTKAVVVHFGTQRISVVDVPGASITKTINIGADLYGPIAINPSGTKAIVDVQNAVRVVNLATDAVSPTISTLGVNGLRTTSDGLYALVIGFSGALVSYASESVVATTNNVLSPNAGAVSPAGPRAAMVGATFNEHLAVMNINGGSGFLEGVAPSGPPPESDKTRKVAISPAGDVAVTSNVLSDTASIVDLQSGVVAGVVAVGDRPADVAITPDGALAVVANLDSTFASVIDLATQAVTNVPISTRNGEVEISPNGQYAYVSVVVNDGVWRIDLDTLAVAGPKLATGDMGGILYSFSQMSGMKLSHDGGTLVTCNSYSNSVSIIDTANWSVVKNVAVAGFPVRAIFNAADSLIYVTSRDNDRVTVINNAGAASAVAATINVGDWPYEMALSADEQTLFVGNFISENVGVVDLSTNTVVDTIPLPYSPDGMSLDASGQRLLVACGDWSVTFGSSVTLNRFGAFAMIDAATHDVLEVIDTGQPPAMLAYAASTQRAYIPAPFGDGLLEFPLADCPADLDGDGLTGIEDLATLLSHYGTIGGATPEEGDLNGDGNVGLDDLAALLAAYGESCD